MFKKKKSCWLYACCTYRYSLFPFYSMHLLLVFFKKKKGRKAFLYTRKSHCAQSVVVVGMTKIQNVSHSNLVTLCFIMGTKWILTLFKISNQIIHENSLAQCLAYNSHLLSLNGSYVLLLLLFTCICLIFLNYFSHKVALQWSEICRQYLIFHLKYQYKSIIERYMREKKKKQSRASGAILLFYT